MIWFVFVILFALSFPCEGQISLPPEGAVFCALNGSDVEIKWTFRNIRELLSLKWTFVTTGKTLATIFQQDVDIPPSSLPRVNATEPATLVLRNVDHRYNGTYRFEILTRREDPDPSEVTVFVAVKPNVTISCSTPTTVNKTDDVRCLCNGEGGNPPANVTWYKNDDQIDTKVEENMLTLSNVSGTDSGTYKCVAESCTLNDTKSINVTVNFAAEVTNFTSSPAKSVLIGQSVNMTCEAIAHPEPINYTIIHNSTYNVSTIKTYTIAVVNGSHAGSYQCIAQNILGKDNKTLNLTVISKDQPTMPTLTPTPTTKPTGGNTGTTSTATPSVGPPPGGTSDTSSPSPGLIAGIIIGVLLFLLIIVFLLWWFKYRKEKSSGEHIGNDVNPSNQGSSAPVMNENAYESLADGEGKKPENLYDEARLGNDNGGSGSTSDTLPPVYATADKDKDKKKNKKKDKKKDEPAPANTPPVYATVDKTRHNEPSVTYATLDTVAMQPTGSSKRDRRDQPTEYASIAQFGVKGDLV